VTWSERKMCWAISGYTWSICHCRRILKKTKTYPDIIEVLDLFSVLGGCPRPPD